MKIFIGILLGMFTTVLSMDVCSALLDNHRYSRHNDSSKDWKYNNNQWRIAHPTLNEINDDGRCWNTNCVAYSNRVLEEVPEYTEIDGIVVPRGYIVCPDCEGGCFQMVCYGGSPYERNCELCCGEGVVEDE